MLRQPIFNENAGSKNNGDLFAYDWWLLNDHHDYDYWLRHSAHFWRLVGHDDNDLRDSDADIDD